MHRSRKCLPTTVVTGLLLLVILIGAGTESNESYDPLADTSWILAAYGDIDDLETVEVRPAQDLGPYEVTFRKAGGKWSAGDEMELGLVASDGCLDAWAAYAVASDNTILTGGWSTTLLDCSHVPEGGPPFLQSLDKVVAFDLISEDSLHIYTSDLNVLVMTRSATSNKADGATPFPSSVRFTSSHPNPFSDSATLQFSLDHPGSVRLAVYDVLGREVAVLLEDKLPAGEHSVKWHAESVPAGQYVAWLAGTSSVDSWPMTLVR